MGANEYLKNRNFIGHMFKKGNKREIDRESEPVKKKIKPNRNQAPLLKSFTELT